ncbi:MAG: sulfur oxidation c-type cytochrome SoxX [Arcobacter sp.]|nr:MAG: sulfur oxidation c-type cytochrome SoxX [Arcobacter sp.]
MKLVRNLVVASAMSGLLVTASVASDADLIAKGDKIFNNKKKGNCFACHDVNGKKIDGPGSFGPKLTGMSYWDDQTLYDTVYDIYAARGIKISAMPAFGTNGWLDDEEIKAVVAYLKTIN